MSQNPYPFVILALVVLVSLWMKGYFRKPTANATVALTPAPDHPSAASLLAEAIRRTKEEHDAAALRKFAEEQYAALGKMLSPFPSPGAAPANPTAPGNPHP